ncbi:unnamed protein product, partial [Mesorhabditis spiculigera]
MSHLNILIRPVLFLLIVAALSHAYSGKGKRSLGSLSGEGMGNFLVGKDGKLHRKCKKPSSAGKQKRSLDIWQGQMGEMLVGKDGKLHSKCKGPASGKAKRSLDIFDGGMGGEMKLAAQPKSTRMPNNARKIEDGTVPHVKLSLDIRPSDEGEMEKPSKRALDSMEDGFGFKKKRALGSLDGAGFGFDKRALDSMDGAGFGFDKRALGSLDGAGFGFDKRALGSLDGAGFGFDKRALGSLDGAGFGFDKRALDSLDGNGLGWAKRSRQHRIMGFGSRAGALGFRALN